MLLLGLASIATSLSPPPNLANCDLTQADVDAAWKAGYEVGKSGGPAPWGPSSPPGPPPGPPPTYEEDATITNADYPKRWYHNEADVQAERAIAMQSAKGTGSVRLRAAHCTPF